MPRPSHAQESIWTIVSDSSVTVTAFREATPVRDSHFSQSTLTFQQQPYLATPAVDEILQQTPGFSLFRRNSSAVANPTTQGLSLRGLGPSGASRALVLYDGTPLNDPFGGWIYWSRVNQAALAAVEIVRGGGSSLFGSSPLSGALQFFPQQKQHVNVATQTFASGAFDISGSLAKPLAKSITLAIDGKTGRTGNYYLIPATNRGAVDVRANADYHALSTKLKYYRDNWLWHLRAAAFAENRQNGTRDQTNKTATFNADALLLKQARANLSFEWRGFYATQDYDQTFSAVAENRDSEQLTRTQTVPAQMAETSLIGRWILRRHHLQFGISYTHKQGLSREKGYTAGTLSSRLSVGGKQQNAGVFVQDRWGLSDRVSLAFSARYDYIHQRQTDSLLTILGTGASANGALVDKIVSATSPRLSFAWAFNERIKLRGAAYSAFRAPTLNELYRGFRVGDIVTAANSQLAPEKMRGFDAGIDATCSGLSLNTTVFYAKMTDAISNVTLDAGDNTIFRRRQNVGGVRAWGVEMEGRWDITPVFAVRGFYTFTRSQIIAAADKSLIGKKTPQVPVHSAYLGVDWRFSRFTWLLDLKANTTQFDDDRNLFKLAGYTIADIQVLANVSQNIQLGAGVHNLFDSLVEVARTPVLSIGQPRTAFVTLSYRH